MQVDVDGQESEHEPVPEPEPEPLPKTRANGRPVRAAANKAKQNAKNAKSVSSESSPTAEGDWELDCELCHRQGMNIVSPHAP